MESSVTHKSAITDHAVEENHVIDWEKAKVVDGEAQRTNQMDNISASDSFTIMALYKSTYLLTYLLKRQYGSGRPRYA